jgi:hypothetical protein
MPDAIKLKRRRRREDACMVPRRLDDGLVLAIGERRSERRTRVSARPRAW